jgi:hypothetical protein
MAAPTSTAEHEKSSCQMGAVHTWRILLKNSVNDQMPKVFCVLSALAYRGDDGGASNTRNLAQTALRGVKVASDCAATSRKNSKGISTTLHIRVFQQNWRITASSGRCPERQKCTRERTLLIDSMVGVSGGVAGTPSGTSAHFHPLRCAIPNEMKCRILASGDRVVRPIACFGRKR